MTNWPIDEDAARRRTRRRTMEYVGGCQCGAIRYRAEGPRDRSCVCYCRMCQKAAGAPFMAFVRFPAAQVHWSKPPAIFASSNHVERGFCPDCGTPLTYRDITGPNISLTIHSLDNPAAVQPEMSFSAEAQVAWCRNLADLPNQTIDLTTSPDFVNYQHGE
jgi:hypothetical protein